ncbi:MAG TPA: O-acetyl-ADP-ribose deacetylase [Candidatus Udaeobacter sp.]|jgi:O-acetyl-ADP-ribose deacetylase (regulator of RNase III)|nr:O-acetyl-ADP-ribose deacetylase [Candidatus Udaeobacter sp.]
MKRSPQSKIEIRRGDITKLDADAIVNAANTSLLGGGGVDGAIHRAAGPELLAECRALGGCEPGEAKITRGYRLPARFVIHTVGPIWRGGKRGEPETLANCHRNSLRLATENRIDTVGFPAISCGAYGYPIDQAALIAVETTREFFANEENIDKVIFVLWDKDIYEAFASTLNHY